MTKLEPQKQGGLKRAAYFKVTDAAVLAVEDMAEKLKVYKGDIVESAIWFFKSEFVDKGKKLNFGVSGPPGLKRSKMGRCY